MGKKGATHQIFSDSEEGKLDALEAGRRGMLSWAGWKSSKAASEQGDLRVRALVCMILRSELVTYIKFKGMSNS